MTSRRMSKIGSNRNVKHSHNNGTTTAKEKEKKQKINESIKHVAEHATQSIAVFATNEDDSLTLHRTIANAIAIAMMKWNWNYKNNM